MNNNYIKNWYESKENLNQKFFSELKNILELSDIKYTFNEIIYRTSEHIWEPVNIDNPYFNEFILLYDDINYFRRNVYTFTIGYGIVSVFENSNNSFCISLGTDIKTYNHENMIDFIKDGITHMLFEK